jgi:hypothetical protein
VDWACSVTRSFVLNSHEGAEVQFQTVNGQLQAPAALSAWKEQQEPTGQEAGWGQGLVWMW